MASLSGGGGGDVNRTDLNGEVFVNFQKKKIFFFFFFFFFFWGGGGGRVGGRVGLGRGQDGCERRIEVFVKIKKHKF